MAEPRNPSNPEQLTKWLGLFISVFAVLAWFGVDNWHEVDAWLHRNDPRPARTCPADQARSQMARAAAVAVPRKT
jgi:cell division protein FtsB